MSNGQYTKFSCIDSLYVSLQAEPIIYSSCEPAGLNPVLGLEESWSGGERGE